MRRSRLAISSAVLACAALTAFMAMPSLASNHIVPEPLSVRSAFPDGVTATFKVKLDGRATDVINIGDPGYTQTWRFTVQEGAMFPWHSHPGTVIVNVTSGTLVYVAADDCQARTYPAGTAFVDAGHGHVHTAYNPGPGATVLMATFFGLPASGPISDVVAPPADCVVTP